MVKVGLREANMHFSKYVDMVRKGQEVVVTERGAPIAVIKPLPRATDPEQRIRMLEDQGVLKRALREKFPAGPALAVKGVAISEAVSEDREERY